MNILQVNTADRGGGAEVVALRLHEQFRQRGHRSWLAVGTKRSRDAHVFEIDNDSYRTAWARRWIKAASILEPVRGRIPGARRLYTWMRVGVAEPARYLSVLRGEEDFAFPAAQHLPALSPDPPDVLHLHNLHGGYFDLRALPQLSRRVPTFVTLHDPWLFSGHCAHSFDCDRWRTGCGSCPDLNLYPQVRRDATAFNWSRKSEIFRNSRLRVIAPSEWMMKQFAASMMRDAVIDARVIPHGVDLTIFKPADKAADRLTLGINPRACVVLFSAAHAQRNPFKNFAMLRSAVEAVAARNPHLRLVFVVLGESASLPSSGNLEVRSVDFDTRPENVARFCRAADVYVHAAKAETFGLAITEAMACGTPVVATDVGGISDQVVDGVTGVLVERNDGAAMTQAIEQLLRDPERQTRMGGAAAEFAKARFGLDLMIQRHLAWYAEAMTGSERQ